MTKESSGTLTLETNSGTITGVDCLLWAIGRLPNTEIGLDKVVRGCCYVLASGLVTQSFCFDFFSIIRPENHQEQSWALAACSQGVQLTLHGDIKVDEFQNTSVPGIYALGDVCGRALLTPGMTSMRSALA